MWRSLKTGDARVNDGVDLKINACLSANHTELTTLLLEFLKQRDAADEQLPHVITPLAERGTSLTSLG